MGDLIRLLMAGGCTLVMLWFGLSSFLRARKIRDHERRTG